VIWLCGPLYEEVGDEWLRIIFYREPPRKFGELQIQGIIDDGENLFCKFVVNGLSNWAICKDVEPLVCVWKLDDGRGPSVIKITTNEVNPTIFKEIKKQIAQEDLGFKEDIYEDNIKLWNSVLDFTDVTEAKIRLEKGNPIVNDRVRVSNLDLVNGVKFLLKKIIKQGTMQPK